MDYDVILATLQDLYGALVVPFQECGLEAFAMVLLCSMVTAFLWRLANRIV